MWNTKGELMRGTKMSNNVASVSFLSIVCAFSIFFPPSCHAKSTLAKGEKLKHNETIISYNLIFELGFFSPNGSSSQDRYLGIWYYNISEQTVVWVANREKPIPEADSNFVLELTSDGNLIIRDGKSSILWSAGVSSSSFPGSDTTATLNDNGNLVIISAGVSLWESFKYPTDTFLPAMKFSRNLTTNQSLMWRSWKSVTDPSPGPYSLGLHNSSFELCLLNGDNPIWRTGPLKGRRFSGIPNMPGSWDLYGFNPSTQGGEYSISVSPNFTGLMRFVLDYTGSVKEFRLDPTTKSWYQYWNQSSTPCDWYNRCGEFSVCQPTSNSTNYTCSCLPGFELRSGRCARKVPIGCSGSGSGSTGFKTLPMMKPPDLGEWVKQADTSVDDCKGMCTNSCSCTGFASADGMGCFIWTVELLDMEQFSNTSDGVDFYLRLDSSELDSSSNSPSPPTISPLPVVISLTILIVIIITLCLIGFFVIWRKHRRLKRVALDARMPYRENDEKGQGLPWISLGTVRAATEDFSDANKLGQGGFGPVYRGKLPEGQEIAVKRLAKSSGQGLEEFMNEVRLIAKLQHRNLVKLVGCCVAEQEKLLIYEYMQNKSLDAFLFDPKISSQLDWGKRFSIVLGIARGLLYLHQDSRLKVVHRDLKASNILLDATLNPKISDFGIARICGADQTQFNTSRVVGTYGYMSPEYAMEGWYSIKSDVFSFGVLVLEIVSGKRMTRFQHHELSLNLLGYSWKLWKEGKALELLDPSLGGLCNPDEVLRCIHVGLVCVQDEASDRPQMCTVVQVLGGEASNLYEPNIPTYFSRRRFTESDSSSIDGDHRNHTVNSLTITGVELR